MVFSSSVFLFLFFPILLMLYALNKNINYRNSVLLGMSLLFYSWGEPKYILIMLASICINYCMGVLIGSSSDNKENIHIKKWFLVITIILNLGLLVYFKYLNFIVGSVNSILDTDLIVREIALPIGISFFTFQGLTYVIDLYRNQVKVQKNPFKLALYISLFPQLVAGPIVRYADVIEEINHREFSVEGFSNGVKRFIIGLSKKVIISNTVGSIADNVFAQVTNGNTTATAWLGIICYTLQIYFDFSGYSDMAIGLGKIFGFDFMENFNFPYISKSITEFWKRWHISLSSFFRDYLYIPLGGNRKGNVYINLLIVFFCTGLWHGASWNFIVWGLWHGLFMLIERSMRNKQCKFPKIIQHIYAMFVILIGWVFFRADNLNYAWSYIKSMFGLEKTVNPGFEYTHYLNNFSIFIIIIAMIFCTPVVNKLKEYFKRHNIENKWLYGISNIGYIILLLFDIMMLITSTYNPFIYFRF